MADVKTMKAEVEGISVCYLREKGDPVQVAGRKIMGRN
jgi:hypothetical protein